MLDGLRKYGEQRGGEEAGKRAGNRTFIRVLE